ncbi:MAG: APC family permease [Anaerolineales bacterium]|nr:APC family permease [Anaerolineales bacterium]
MSNLFVRKATGLVRSWSVMDAFVYAFFSINLITLGLYIFSQMYFFQGGLVSSLIVSAIFIFFEVIVYAGLIAVMPRSGGDYVWQSRILGGAVGFILAVTGWWFILWLWVPLYGDMFRHIVLVPLLAILGMKDSAIWFAGQGAPLFVSSLITLGIVTVYIALGMKTYARIQKVCFYGGMIGLLIVIALLLGGNPDQFRTSLVTNSSALFGTGTDIIERTTDLGNTAAASTPLTGGALWPILLTLPYLVFFNLWPNWGATLYGEVRGATDFKRNISGMGWALIATTILGIMLLYGIGKAVGWDFYMQANGAWWNFVWEYTDQAPAMPFWPYPTLFAAFLTPSRALQFIVVALMSLWWFGWSGTVFLSSTRVIFAAAFDRLLPEWAAKVDERTGTPVNALLLMLIPSVFISYFFAYDVFGFKALTLCSTLVIAVTYLGTTISAIILPYRKPELYNASPIAKYKVLGIPLITVAGVVFGVFLLFLLVEWLFDPWLNGFEPGYYGISLLNRNSAIYMLSMYAIAAIIYFGFKSARKRQGIDMDKVQAEIPVE